MTTKFLLLFDSLTAIPPMLPLAKVSAMVGINLNLSNGKQYTTIPYQTSEAKIEHVPECRKPTQYACVRTLDTRITRAVFGDSRNVVLPTPQGFKSVFVPTRCLSKSDVVRIERKILFRTSKIFL